MDILLLFSTPFIATLGMSVVGLLFLAMLLGLLTAVVFVGIFYTADRLGKAASRRSEAGS
jgi:hypothetical protein